MRYTSVYIVSCFAAAVTPFLQGSPPPELATVPFPGWPSRLEGKPLTPLPLSPRDQKFAQGFPGRVGRFSDGKREIVIRWVTRGTRKLHPSSDCFRGEGYSIKPLPIRKDANGGHWAGFEAIRGKKKIRVYEAIRDESGRSWPDVSAWYWSTLLGRTPGPWWAFTVAEQDL